MNLVDILLLSIALGLDCMVVSFSQGLVLKNDLMKNSLILAFTMGIFQGAMPFIGYTGGDYIYNFVYPFSKFIVFAIFFVLGLNFILESFNQNKKETPNCLGYKCLLSLGVATSIDALVAGANINLTLTPLFPAALYIGIIAFIMSFAGFWAVKYFKNLPAQNLEISGGLILVFLAVKSLFF